MPPSRLLAILFTDLVGSTETVARLGRDAGEAWRQRAIAVMREALAASRGREVQHTGDGLFAAFESASDAVACGISIQQRLAQTSQRRDAVAPIAARVGIAAGEAREDADGVHGLVVVESSRLCAAANAGQILASALVAALAAGGAHRFSSVGEIALKGLPAPVAVREVLWERGEASVPLSPRIVELARETFVGRVGERAKLDASLLAARRGERRIALIAGEPGIGKTRLAAEIARAAHDGGAIVLDGRCDGELSAPFQPWIQALAHLSIHAAEDDLRSLLTDDSIHALPLLPELRRRFPDLAPSGEAAESERWNIFEAIDALFAAASRGALIVLLLDDLHWADGPSLALLRHLARSPRPAALLVLGTYRETDLARTHPLSELLGELRREPHVERVLLRGLERVELAALVAARAEHEAPEAFVRVLHAETEGNPFFAVEVLRHLIEAGALRREGDRWVGTRPLSELGIPEGVRDVIGRRLSRLSETTNEALRAASVIGREFELPELEAASGLARDALLDALDEASRGRILVDVPGATGRFAFAHALIRQALYEELGSAQRMRLHWRIGEALERRHARDPEPHAAAIAQHFAEGVLAGDPLRALDASLRAGASAAGVSGHEDAQAHFERALAVADQAGLGEPDRRYSAWSGIGLAYFNLGDTRYIDAFLAAFAIAQEQGWAERMARAALDVAKHIVLDPAVIARVLGPLEAALAALGDKDTPERARMLARYALVANFADADYERMAATWEQAAAIARRCEDESVQIEIERACNFLLLGSPRPTELERVARQSYAIGMSSGDWFIAGLSLTNLVSAAIARGDRASIDAMLADEFPKLTQLTGARHSQQYGLVVRGSLALAEGRFDDAKRIAADARDAWRLSHQASLLFRVQLQAARLEQGRDVEVARLLAEFLESAPRWLQYQRALLARVFAEAGRSEAARRELAAFEALQLQPQGWAWTSALRQLAETCLLLADPQRAAALVPRLEPYAGLLLSAYGYTVIESSADRARGQLAATLGDLDRAIACYESGLALEESFGAHALVARTRYWLARGLAERGDTERARREARDARDAAHGFGMQALASRADELLDGISAR